MTILFIGQIDMNSTRIVNRLAVSNSISVLALSEPEYELEADSVKIISKNAVLPETDKQIDLIIYLKMPSIGTAFEDCILRYAVNHSVKRVFAIAPMLEFVPERTDITSLLIDKFRADFGLNATELILPPIYSDDTAPFFLSEAYIALRNIGSYSFPNSPATIYDAVHIEDVCTLIEAMIKTDVNSGIYSCDSRNSFMLKKLGNSLAKHFPHTKIDYETTCGACITRQPSDISLEWVPMHSFISELDEQLALLEQEFGRITERKKTLKRAKLLKLLSFCGLAGLLFVYDSLMPTSAALQFVDLRLLFIIFSSLVYSSGYGIAASLICCADSIIQAIGNGTKWAVLFYHVNNWIPLAIYLAVACICWLYKNKSVEERGEE